MSISRAAVVAGLLVVGALASVGCGGDDGDTEPSGRGGGPGPGVDVAVPIQSLRDVVSYADRLAVVEVVGERDLPPVAGQEPDLDEDYVAREVTLRLQAPLWRRPGAPAPERRLDTVAFGSVVQGGERIPMRVRGSQRLEVGRRYLMPLVRTHGEWGPYPYSTLALDGDRTAARVNGGPPPPTVAALAGKSLEEVAELVAATEPDPLAVKHSDLPPAARWQAVDREREAARR